MSEKNEMVSQNGESEKMVEKVETWLETKIETKSETEKGFLLKLQPI